MSSKTPIWIPIVVWVMSLIWLIPFLGLVISSLRPAVEVASGWWTLDPLTFTLNAWSEVWRDFPLTGGLLASFKLAGLATLGTVLFAPAAAYAFEFLKFPLRRTLLVIIVNAFVLPQQIVVIPLFRLWRSVDLMDTIWGVLIPYVGLSFAWSIYMVKNFLEDFPRELVEAARVDGCGPIRTYFHIVLPNSLSAILALAILQFLFCWNSLLIPLLFLRTETPLPVVFATISGRFETNFHTQSAAAIITTIVPLAVFIIFQRHFAAGATARSGNKE